MNNLRLNFSGAELSRLRASVQAVAKEIALVTSSAMPGERGLPKSALETTWTDLVKILDLGSEPAMRTCPHCRALCMAEATRCAHCWASLPALGPQSDDADGSEKGRDASQRAAASR